MSSTLADATSSQSLFDLISALSYETRKSIVSDSNCPNELLSVLMWDEDLEIRKSAVLHGNVKADSLDETVSILNMHVQSKQENNDYQEVLDTIASKFVKLSVRSISILKTACSGLGRENLVANSLRFADPKESANIWSELAQDQSEFVREAVAMHTDDPQIISILENDEAETVRFAANARSQAKTSTNC